MPLSKAKRIATTDKQPPPHSGMATTGETRLPDGTIERRPIRNKPIKLFLNPEP